MAESYVIKCVCTDEQGRFQTTSRYRCAGGKPDLYFKAVQCIGGSLHTLSPFGGTLGFRHGYSSGIPYNVAGKPAYYRWLYNQLDSGGIETDWREFAAPVADTVVRYYVDYDLAHPDLPPTFPAYSLGPQEKNGMHLYEFKPHQPPQIPNHKREWPVDDWLADIYSGILQSASLPGGVLNAAGKYKIKLEIYDKDGNRISPGPGSFDFIVPTGLETP